MFKTPLTLYWFSKNSKQKGTEGSIGGSKLVKVKPIKQKEPEQKTPSLKKPFKSVV